MKKVVSISLTLILLLGNIGITHGTHFCGGQAVLSEFMIGQELMDCGMDMMEMRHSNEASSFSIPDCCANEYISADTGEALKPQLTGKKILPLQTVVLPVLLYAVEFSRSTDPNLTLIPSPPLIDQDIPVLIQSFLL
ncbi:MAG: hypothetical protein RJQ14_13755 [Marinoscillum sp.]